MKLTVIGSNQTQLELNKTKILFSYQTPVAALNLTPEFFEEHGASMIKTSTKHSRTTQRHINQWCGTSDVLEVEQNVLDSIVRG